MGTLLLHDPWVHVYLLYVGALVIPFICASCSGHARRIRGRIDGRRRTETSERRGRRRKNVPTPGVGRAQAKKHRYWPRSAEKRRFLSPWGDFIRHACKRSAPRGAVHEQAR